MKQNDYEYRKFETRKRHAERYNLKMDKVNFILFIFSSICFISSWFVYHYLNWHIIDTGLLVMLGLCLFANGDYHYLIGKRQNHTSVKEDQK